MKEITNEVSLVITKRSGKNIVIMMKTAIIKIKNKET